MSMLSTAIADFPPDIRAVLFRQFARDAESIADETETSDGQASYRLIAANWRVLAERWDTPTLVAPLSGAAEGDR